MKLLYKKIRNRLMRYTLNSSALAACAQMNLRALDHLQPSREARSFDYVVLDIETTGLDFRHDGILSIGALRIRNGNIQLGSVFHELIRPGISIPPSSIKIHGIVPDMVHNARRIDDVFDDFLSFIGVDILIAHNACFDLEFLNAVMNRKYSFHIQNLTLDTLLLCKEIAFPSHQMYPYGINLRSIEFSLEAITKHYGIDFHHRHTALGDALAAGMIFQRVLTKAESQGRGKLKTLIKHGAI